MYTGRCTYIERHMHIIYIYIRTYVCLCVCACVYRGICTHVQMPIHVCICGAISHGCTLPSLHVPAHPRMASTGCAGWHLFAELSAACLDNAASANLFFMAGYRPGRSAMANSAPDAIITTASITLGGQGSTLDGLDGRDSGERQSCEVVWRVRTRRAGTASGTCHAASSDHGRSAAPCAQM